MASRNVPNVNASLIREVRMIAQQFFRSKENSTFWETHHGKTKTTASPAFKCARCLGQRKSNPGLTPRDAVTIFEGTAVCEQHV